MVFNDTINNIPFLSWRSIVLVEKTGVPGENHRPVASHSHTLSHNVLSYISIHITIIKFKKNCFQRLLDAIYENDLDLAKRCIRLKADVNYSRDVSSIHSATDSMR